MCILCDVGGDAKKIDASKTAICIEDCRTLKHLPPIVGAGSIICTNCPELVSVHLADTTCDASFFECPRLTELIPTESLSLLSMSGCNLINTLPSPRTVPNMSQLWLSDCKHVTYLPFYAKVKHSYIYFSGCPLLAMSHRYGKEWQPDLSRIRSGGYVLNWAQRGRNLVIAKARASLVLDEFLLPPLLAIVLRYLN